MRYIIDTEKRAIQRDREGSPETVDLYSDEGFALLSRLWLTVGWALKYSYQFTWLGRPVIQLPEDMIRLQELVYQLQPDVILETGVAHGGNQVFLASLCRLLGRGRVIGVDIEIRPHNRIALAAHPLYPLITLIEGSSTDPVVVAKVKAEIRPDEKVLVLLDSNHTRDHVLRELEAYASLVGVGSYIIAADGIMEDLVGVPRAKPEWTMDNPRQAVAEFARHHPEFALVEPPKPFDEAMVHTPITYWPAAHLRRVR